MPFINGRYYINPTVGAAIEAARAAEEAMRSGSPSNSSRAGEGNHASEENLADDRESSAARDADPWRDGDEPESRARENGPIHRVEIEAAEVVPSSTGRAARGFVARVHRHAPAAPSAAQGAGAASRYGGTGHAMPLRSETHAFTDHRDLLDFLADELSRDHRTA